MTGGTARPHNLGTMNASHVLVPVAERPARSATPEASTRTLRSRIASLWSQLWHFALIGVVSTLAFYLIYAALRGWLGPQASNLIANVVTAVANTAANRRLTFGVTERRGLVKDHIGGLITFGFALGITSGSLWLLRNLLPGAGRPVEIGVLFVAQCAATLFRFVVLKRLMGGRSRGATAPPADTTPDSSPGLTRTAGRPGPEPR